MFRFKLDLEFGRVPDEEPQEPLPGEGGPGSAQVEDGGPQRVGLMSTGFCLPEQYDHGPEGPY